MRASSPWLLFGVVFGAAVASGCYLESSPTTPDDPSPTIDCSVRRGGEAPMRRLSRREYDNTVRDLLGDTTQPAIKTFPVDAVVNGYDNNAAVLTVSTSLATAQLNAAEALATKAVADLPKLLACDAKVKGEDACAKTFFTTFGKRAYRRPLTDEEVATLVTGYQSDKAQWGFSEGIRLGLEKLLMSPSFLYRVELGAAANDPSLVPLTPYERASRLSYLFWSSMPDDALFAAADAGKLETPEQVEIQAQRMLADPKARDAVAAFHLAWLGLDGRVPQKVATVYPEYSPTIATAQQRETVELVKNVIFDDKGTLGALLTSPYTFVNADLAKFYGLSGPKGALFEKVATDPSVRLGILGQGSVLSTWAKPDESSPVLRGKLVRTRLLCQSPPPPPPNVPQPSGAASGGTTRERYAEHSKNPACAGCHNLMDPIGFGFENFDGTGRYRALDQGKPIDASGQLSSTDVDGAFVGEPELAKRLATSGQVQRCYAVQLFRYGQGRTETKEDTCALRELDAVLAQSDGDVKRLYIALAKSDAFLFRKAPTP